MQFLFFFSFPASVMKPQHHLLVTEPVLKMRICVGVSMANICLVSMFSVCHAMCFANMTRQNLPVINWVVVQSVNASILWCQCFPLFHFGCSVLSFLTCSGSTLCVLERGENMKLIDLGKWLQHDKEWKFGGVLNTFWTCCIFIAEWEFSGPGWQVTPLSSCIETFQCLAGGRNEASQGGTFAWRGEVSVAFVMSQMAGFTAAEGLFSFVVWQATRSG